MAWSHEQEEILRRDYGKYYAFYIAKDLGVSVAAVHCKSVRMGLTEKFIEPPMPEDIRGVKKKGFRYVLTFKGKYRSLYQSWREAALEYNRLATEAFGDKAKLNKL